MWNMSTLNEHIPNEIWNSTIFIALLSNDTKKKNIVQATGHQVNFVTFLRFRNTFVDC